MLIFICVYKTYNIQRFMVMIAKNRKSLFYEMKRFQVRITMNSQLVRLEEIKVPKAEC